VRYVVSIGITALYSWYPNLQHVWLTGDHSFCVSPIRAIPASYYSRFLVDFGDTWLIPTLISFSTKYRHATFCTETTVAVALQWTSL